MSDYEERARWREENPMEAFKEARDLEEETTTVQTDACKLTPPWEGAVPGCYCPGCAEKRKLWK